MICRACSRRILPAVRIPGLSPFRQLSTSRPFDGAASATPSPVLSTPLSSAGSSPPAADATTSSTHPKQSNCPAGTVLSGLNYIKGRSDPVALEDHEYPDWLWRCLDVQKDASAAADEGAGDEFSKSKKQRKLAARRQKQQEAAILASGNLEALAPKIPLQQQSINLPGQEGGGLPEALHAASKREELRRAMRRERKAKIKESNYLKSM